MGTLDATCELCNAAFRWLTGSRRICAQCRAAGEDVAQGRYVNVGCEVWDLAWSDPRTGTWTAGLTREAVVTRYPSVQAAFEACQSLNDNEPTTWEEREKRFAAAAADALANAKEDKETRAALLPAWVEDIDGLDTL